MQKGSLKISLVITFRKCSQVQSSPFRVTFLSLILLVSCQVILTLYLYRCDMEIERQVTEPTNQLVRFDVNPEPRVKLHHLLQKCSFFLIKLAALATGDRAEQRTAEYRISNRRIMKGGNASLNLF